MCLYKDWLPNERSGSKPVLQWQSVLPHTCLPTVCLFVAEGTSVQSSGMPASARRRRFRKVPIHGSYEGKMAPIFYPNLWFLRGQDGSNLLPQSMVPARARWFQSSTVKGDSGGRFSCRTFSARLLSDVSRETAPGTLSLTGELFDLRHAISGRFAFFRKKAGFAPRWRKATKISKYMRQRRVWMPPVRPEKSFSQFIKSPCKEKRQMI